jgi:hypothetical protein
MGPDAFGESLKGRRILFRFQPFDGLMMRRSHNVSTTVCLLQTDKGFDISRLSAA